MATYQERLAQAIWLAKGVLRGVTEEQAQAIGRMAIEAEDRGENYAIWHQSALYFGRPCNCAQCRAHDDRK